jgi:hypothetical protein
MNKVLAVILMFTANIAFAENWQDPNASFDARKVLTNKSTITWVRVNNLQATCEAESKKRGLGGFGYGVHACSFWEGNTCTIITSNNPSIHDLGHEARHCFQGNYH